MYYDTYVGFVDAHAEGVGGYYDACVAFGPLFLFAVFVFGGYAGVEEVGGYTVGVEELGVEGG